MGGLWTSLAASLLHLSTWLKVAFPEGSIEEKEGDHADKDLLVLVEAFAASSFFFLTSSPERQGKVLSHMLAAYAQRRTESGLFAAVHSRRTSNKRQKLKREVQTALRSCTASTSRSFQALTGSGPEQPGVTL